MLTDFLDRVVPVTDVPNSSDWRLKQSYQSSRVKHSCRRRKLMATSPLKSPISSHLALSSPPIQDCCLDSPDGDAYDSSPSDSSMNTCDVETAHPIVETAMELQQIFIVGSQNAGYRLHVGQIIDIGICSM